MEKVKENYKRTLIVDINWKKILPFFTFVEFYAKNKKFSRLLLRKRVYADDVYVNQKTYNKIVDEMKKSYVYYKEKQTRFNKRKVKKRKKKKIKRKIVEYSGDKKIMNFTLFDIVVEENRKKRFKQEIKFESPTISEEVKDDQIVVKY